ncbi:hypothetical protein C6H65_22025 [Photorhabdus luminescens]|nr:hypothetical protein C6H65_22025 [Photorhabdus luminescens]
MSLGRPPGASGGRILANAIYQLHRQQGKLALGRTAACNADVPLRSMLSAH